MEQYILISGFIVLYLIAFGFLKYPLKLAKTPSWLFWGLTLTLVTSSYLYWGSYFQWQAYESKLLKTEQAKQLLSQFKDPQELIAVLRTKLDNSPQSAKGWYLLGRLYSGQNAFAQAVKAFRKAQALDPKNELYLVNYAHGLWQLNQKQFNPQIIELFSQLLTNNSQQADALAMLAMNAFQEKDYVQAIDYWKRLLQLVASESHEADSIRRAIAQAEQQLK